MNWLSLAKQLPVGESSRFSHCGRRQSAVVFNNADCYSFYCHKCGTSGRTPKQYVTMKPKKTPKIFKIPDDITPIIDADNILALKFLYSKGLSLLEINHHEKLYKSFSIGYSKSINRICVSTHIGDWLCRTIGDDERKWLKVGNTTDFHLFQSLIDVETKAIVLVEDIFSAIKVNYVAYKYRLPVHVVCSLGTGVHDKLKAFLYALNLPLLVFYDGDVAGLNGYKKIKKNILLPNVYLGVDGKDPKDLFINAIKERLVYGFEHITGNGTAEELHISV